MTRNYSNVLSSHFVCLCQASVYFCVMKSTAIALHLMHLENLFILFNHCSTECLIALSALYE